MRKIKKAKLVKKGVSTVDKEQIEEIYKVRAYATNGVYLTPVMHDKSTNVRMTFTEFNFTLGKHIAVCAISISIEDLQTNYNAITELLQQMRTMGRIA